MISGTKTSYNSCSAKVVRKGLEDIPDSPARVILFKSSYPRYPGPFRFAHICWAFSDFYERHKEFCFPSATSYLP